MSQKLRDQKQGGGGAAPLSDIKNNEALKAAAAAGRQALRKIQSVGDEQGELQIKQQRRMVMRTIYICTCGHPTCGIGPFVTPMTVSEEEIGSMRSAGNTFKFSPS